MNDDERAALMDVMDKLAAAGDTANDSGWVQAMSELADSARNAKTIIGSSRTGGLPG